MMNQEPDRELEQLIHRRLRALPEPAAPQDLLPKVLRRIAAPRPPSWWRSPWFEWPRGMRILSAILFAAVFGGAWCFAHDIMAAANLIGVRLADTFQFLRPLFTVVEALTSVLQLLVGAIKSQYLILGAGVIAALYLSAVGLGTVCYRLAAGKN